MFRQISLAYVTIVLLLHFNHTYTKGIFEKLQTSFEIAGKMLGLDKAKSVAKLVSDAFGKSGKKGDEGEGGQNIFSGFLRIFGFDSRKIGAIAINAIIFVAQLISTSLSRKPIELLNDVRRVKDGTPLEWMMNNTEVTNLIEHITNKDLPERVIQYVKERSLDEESGCIQLLICKGSPFVWGMQKVLVRKNEENFKGRNAFYSYFPGLEEIVNYADECDKKYPYCFYLD